MPLGFTNAPTTFKRLMECDLAGLMGEECLIYLDDIIVFSSSFKEHLFHLTKILPALCNAGLQLKPSKCHLAHDEVRYLPTSLMPLYTRFTKMFLLLTESLRSSNPK